MSKTKKEWVQGKDLTNVGYYFKFSPDPFCQRTDQSFLAVFIRMYGGKFCQDNWEVNHDDWFFKIEMPPDLPPGHRQPWTADDMVKKC